MGILPGRLLPQPRQKSWSLGHGGGVREEGVISLPPGSLNVLGMAQTPATGGMD